MMEMIGFEEDLFLYVSFVLAAAALLLFVASLFMSRLREKLSLCFQILIWSAFALLFAGPYLRKTSPQQGLAVYVDVSESMNARRASEVLSNLRAQLGDNDAVFYPFSSERNGLASVSSSADYSRMQGAIKDQAVTHIEQIVSHAEDNGHESVLLLTDGHENRGDILSRLEESSVKISPLLPSNARAVSSGFSLKNLSAPITADAGKSVPIQVAVENTTDDDRSGLLEITQDGKTLLQERVTLSEASSKIFEAESSDDKAGISEIVASFTPADRDEPQRILRRYLTRLAEEKLLLMHGTTADARFLNQILKEKNFKVENYVGNVPKDVFRKGQKFKAVIMNNIAAPALSPLLIQDVASYVKEGGGLIMIGGNRSFGLGGYQKTPIEEVLPVKLLTPKKEQKRLNVAVELVLDKSRSMSFGNKIEFAKEAAREVIRNLKDDDYVGIIGFDTTPFIVFPLRRLKENRSMALSRVGSLFPVGKTNLFPAMDEARRSLVQVQAGRKHMIVLTDGKIPDGGRHYLDLVDQLRTNGITVSTVMMGGEADTRLLRKMAEQGGGAFYQTTDARALPRIFLSDIKVSTGEKTMRENREYVVRKGKGQLESTSLNRFPSLKGYVQTKAKEGANVELITFAAGTSEPLLVSWEHEKGKATAFTSDANGRWSRSWIRWPYFRQFWVELMESLAPKENEDTERYVFDLRHTVKHGKFHLELLFYDKEPTDAVSAIVTGPADSEGQTVSFTRRAPGRYEASLPIEQGGRYDILSQVGSQKLPMVAVDVPAEKFGERKGLGYRLPFLHQIAETSGGEVNPPIQKLLTSQGEKVEKEDLTHWVFILIIFFLLLKIFFRERRSSVRFNPAYS